MKTTPTTSTDQTTTITKRGTGCLLRQPGRRNWMAQYYVNGVRYMESTGTSNKTAAQRFLAGKVGKVADGETIDPTTIGKRAYRFDAAADAYLAALKRNGRVCHDAMRRTVDKHLRPAFGDRRLDQITASDITDYVDARINAPAKRSTINLELAALKSTFILALAAGKITTRPTIAKLEDEDPREGFFEHAAYVAVHAALPAWLQGPVTFAYLTGWRLASEVLLIEWRHVDLHAGIVKIDKSKNGKGRTFPFAQFPALAAVFAEAKRVHDAAAAEGRIIARVFHKDGAALVDPPAGSKRTGDLCDWARAAWKAACVTAGEPTRIPHDFRRTAVRNLVRAGVPQKTARTLTGHKTNHVFDRYDIVDESDLTHYVTKYAAHHAAR